MDRNAAALPKSRSRLGLESNLCESDQPIP